MLVVESRSYMKVVEGTKGVRRGYVDDVKCTLCQQVFEYGENINAASV